jgi:hypothetical protein
MGERLIHRKSSRSRCEGDHACCGNHIPACVLTTIDANGHSDLTEWAKHGVLLLNTALTVRAHSVSQIWTLSRDWLADNNVGWLPLGLRMGSVHRSGPASSHDSNSRSNRNDRRKGPGPHGMGRPCSKDDRDSGHCE